MQPTAYKYPLYYEIAFSFINTKKQADFFKKLIKKYSKIKIKRILDIACGPSLQLIEMAKRGYDAVGLDLSPQMLSYLKSKAKKENVKIETIKANMKKFKLKKKADFAMIMMGSISYVGKNEDFLSHLDSVASSLKRGALYFIENFRLDWTAKGIFRGAAEWTMKRAGITVKTYYNLKVKNALTQMLLEDMKLYVNDNGKRRILKEKVETKQIFPEELKMLVEKNGKFEFLGFFKHFKMEQLDKEENMNFILLRRK